MLQQYKRLLIKFNENNDDQLPTIQHLQKEHPNLSLYLISQFILSWICRSENDGKKSFNSLIGMSIDQYITNAFIKKNYFSLFDFNINNNENKIAMQQINVDVMKITDQQYNLIQIIASKFKDSNNKYIPQINKLFQRP